MSDDTQTSRESIRVDALKQAVKHHGLANYAPDAVPAGTRTVLETATTFEHYILTGATPARTR